MKRKSVKIETPNRLNVLKDAEALFSEEELNLIRYKQEPKFFLSQALCEAPVTSLSPLDISKYILKSSERNDSIDPSLLEKDSMLSSVLSALIREKVGEEYVTIVVRYSEENYDETEFFCLKFLERISKGLSGFVRIDMSDKKPDRVSGEDVSSGDTIHISVNKVLSDFLVYKGADFKDKNVVFLGNDIELNKYLYHLFQQRAPKKILNITPHFRYSFFHQNVD
jgi:hypothetical protein